MRVIVFRVSKEFLAQINSYCEREEIGYNELFHRAIEHLIEKYLGGDKEKRASSRGADRDGNKDDNVSEASENSSDAR